MSFIIGVLAFVIALGLIVFIHELGHFASAKIFGLYVNEFALGFGPTIWSKKGKETTYALRAIPLGGFVSVVGEQNDMITPNDDNKIDPSLYVGRTVNDLNTVKKMIFTLAGVIMNFLLALAVMSSILLSYETIQGEVGTTIETIVEGMPASEVDILPGDTIVAAKSHGIKSSINSYEDLTYYMASYDGTDNLTLYLKRGEHNIETTFKPKLQDGSYVMGITFKAGDPVTVTIWNCVPLAFKELWSLAKAIFNALKGLIVGVGLNQLGGPIAIYQATSEAAQMGLDSYLLLLASLSMNVGIFNLIPLPAFDGGRTLIYLIEGITRRKMSAKLERLLMSISFALILMLFTFVMFKDIVRLF